MNKTNGLFLCDEINFNLAGDTNNLGSLPDEQIGWQIDLNPAQALSVTGMVKQAAGALVTLWNIGAFDITLTHNTVSDAGNRFFFPDDLPFILTPNASCPFMWKDHNGRAGWWMITSEQDIPPVALTADVATGADYSATNAVGISILGSLNIALVSENNALVTKHNQLQADHAKLQDEMVELKQVLKDKGIVTF